MKTGCGGVSWNDDGTPRGIARGVIVGVRVAEQADALQRAGIEGIEEAELADSRDPVIGGGPTAECDAVLGREIPNKALDGLPERGRAGFAHRAIAGRIPLDEVEQLIEAAGLELEPRVWLSRENEVVAHEPLDRFELCLEGTREPPVVGEHDDLPAAAHVRE